jgi:CHAT domain-containing protein/tetratricopeptide (TPR) repeat protein
MSVEVTESPDAPGSISAEEWSILEPLLPDRWPDGRPRPWYPPVLDVLRIAAMISLLACACGYLLVRLAGRESVIFGVGVILYLVMLVLFAGLVRAILVAARTTMGGPAAENVPPPFAARIERFARLFAAGQGQEADHKAAAACQLARWSLGAAHPVLAELLYGRAMLQVTMDEPSMAVALIEEADRIWLGALAPDSRERADVEIALAMLYQALENAPRAEQHYRSCAKTASRLGGPGIRLAVSSLQALGEILEERGDGAEAEALYQRVVKLLGDHPGAGSKRALIALDKLIAVHLIRQDYPAARSLMLRVLHMTHRDYPEGHPFLADRLDDLGQLYHSMGAYARADPLYARAQDIRRRAFGTDTPLYTLSLCNRAELAAAIGDPASALDLLRRMSAVENQFVGRAVLSRSEQHLMSYIYMFYTNMCKYLTIVVKHYPTVPHTVTAAFDLVERRKAAGIEALAARREVMVEALDPRRAEGLERLTQLRWQIARMSRTGLSAGESAAAYRRRLEGLKAERDDLEVELARLAPVPDRDAVPSRAGRLVSPRDVPDGAVLIEFVRFHVFRFEAVPAHDEPRWGTPRYLAFVFPSALTHDVELYDLGEAGPIERWITEFRAEVGTDPGGSRRRDMAARRETPAGPEASRVLEADQALYGALLRPLFRSIGDRRKLLLAPDGDLNRLPFEVLQIGQGRRLIEDYEVSYVVAGRDLRTFAQRARGRRAAGPPLVLADPDFDSLEDSAGTKLTQSAGGRAILAASRRSVEIELDDHQFDRLPASRAEGEEVAALLGVKPAMGTLASESCLKSCRSPRILHLATHGFFLSDQDIEGERLQAMLEAQPWMEDAILEARRAAREPTFLDRVFLFGWQGAVISPDLFADLSEIDREMARVRQLARGARQLAELEQENPLLRSGLALAGANVGLRGADSPQAEDGLLTAEDVTGLDRVDTELVVLSACETGLGEVRTGEGVFGLRRAFVLAGAKTLVMSLWKVPDEPTRELMVNYYRLLLAGRGRAQALREAQLAMMASYPDPYYWGAFICQGDPSPLNMPRTATADASVVTTRPTT